MHTLPFPDATLWDLENDTDPLEYGGNADMDLNRLVLIALGETN